VEKKFQRDGVRTIVKCRRNRSKVIVSVQTEQIYAHTRCHSWYSTCGWIYWLNRGERSCGWNGFYTFRRCRRSTGSVAVWDDCTELFRENIINLSSLIRYKTGEFEIGNSNLTKTGHATVKK